MRLDELRTEFPGVHVLFVDSPVFRLSQAGKISGDLIAFLRSHGLNGFTNYTQLRTKQSSKPVLYGHILTIHGRVVDLEDEDFASLSDARDHGLRRALTMFMQEPVIGQPY